MSSQTGEWYWVRARDSRASKSVDIGNRAEVPASSIHRAAQPCSDWPCRPPIAVVAGWMLSQPKHVTVYAKLLNDCGWDVLVCHPPLLHLWIPTRAAALATDLLRQLKKELRGHPRPIALFSFSGGWKSCLWQLFETLNEHPPPPSTLSPSAPLQPCMSPCLSPSAPHCMDSSPPASLNTPASLSDSHKGTCAVTAYSLAASQPSGSQVDSQPAWEQTASEKAIGGGRATAALLAGEAREGEAARDTTVSPPTTAGNGAAAEEMAATADASTVTAAAAAPSTTTVVADAAVSDTTSLTVADRTFLLSCLSAAIFDSSPVDFISQLGVRFLSQSQAPATGGSDVGLGGALRFIAASLGAAVLNATMHTEFERQRAAQWQALVALAGVCPVLVLYSPSDHLASPPYVRRFIAALKDKGGSVSSVCFPHSQHVGHLRTHRLAYEESLRTFLEAVRQQWQAKRAKEGCATAGTGLVVEEELGVQRSRL